MQEYRGGTLSGELGDVAVDREGDAQIDVYDDGFNTSITISGTNDEGDSAMVMVDTTLDLDDLNLPATLTISEGEATLTDGEGNVQDTDAFVVGCSGEDPSAWDIDLDAEEATVVIDEDEEGNRTIEIESDYEDEASLDAKATLKAQRNF